MKSHRQAGVFEDGNVRGDIGGGHPVTDKHVYYYCQLFCRECDTCPTPGCSQQVPDTSGVTGIHLGELVYLPGVFRVLVDL